MKIQKLNHQLLAWYNQHARDLPWRDSHDPYRIWISEVMLQQTRVETVIPYYQRWMMTFPDLARLAASGENEVMQLWEGLGYYGRVRNILKTSHILIKDNQGRFPETIKELKALPGIGDYIAGALASIAFGQNEIALDGNGLRVIARVVDYKEPVNRPAAKADIRQVMQEMLPEGNAGDFNQAVMDLGSLICTVKNPQCNHCPIQSECLAFKLGTQSKVPIREAKKPLPQYEVVAAVIQQGNKVLIDKRKADGLLGGLWEFPGGKVEVGEDLHSALIREIKEELGVDFIIQKKLGKYKHAYTHFKVTVFVFSGQITSGEPRPLVADEIQWAAVQDLERYPMGKVDRLISLSII
jgi:A/G-specific adenine glycosylase